MTYAEMAKSTSQENDWRESNGETARTTRERNAAESLALRRNDSTRESVAAKPVAFSPEAGRPLDEAGTNKISAAPTSAGESSSGVETGSEASDTEQETEGDGVTVEEGQSASEAEREINLESDFALAADDEGISIATADSSQAEQSRPITPSGSVGSAEEMGITEGDASEAVSGDPSGNASETAAPIEEDVACESLTPVSPHPDWARSAETTPLITAFSTANATPMDTPSASSSSSHTPRAVKQGGGCRGGFELLLAQVSCFINQSAKQLHRAVIEILSLTDKDLQEEVGGVGGKRRDWSLTQRKRHHREADLDRRSGRRRLDPMNGGAGSNSRGYDNSDNADHAWITHRRASHGDGASQAVSSADIRAASPSEYASSPSLSPSPFPKDLITVSDAYSRTDGMLSVFCDDNEVCRSCGTNRTPQWRYIYVARFCNACYMKIKRFWENRGERRLPSRVRESSVTSEDARVRYLRQADAIANEVFDYRVAERG